MTGVVLGVLLAAAAPGLVGVFAKGCDAALEARLVSELRFEGFEPVHLEPDAPRAQGELARIAVRCAADEHRALARIEDHLTEKRVERSVPLDGRDPRGFISAALRIVELLHASLAEARYTPRLQEVPEPARSLIEPPQPSRWHVEVGFAVLGATAVIGAEPGLQVAVTRVLGPVELSAEATFSIYGTRIVGTGGSADVGLGIARAVLALPLASGPLVLRPQLGLGVLAASAVGHASPTYDASTGVASAPSASFGVSASWAASPWVDVRSSVAAGVSFPSLTLRFPDSSDRDFGQPYVFGSLGVSLH